MKEELRSPVSAGIGRAARSKLALAIVAVLLLATFSPVSWFRGWLPRGSSPARSLGEWVEYRRELSDLLFDDLFIGPKARAIESALSPLSPEDAVSQFLREKRPLPKNRPSGTTPASSQFDDLFYHPTVPTGDPTAEPVQAARGQPPIAD
jgi:hypothetical protein